VNALKIAVIVVGSLTVLTACTLLLPTEELIKPCVSDDECDEGFECLENACLPLDEGDVADEGVSG
jgi:hypothetical protein